MNINCDYDELEIIGLDTKKNGNDLTLEIEKWEKALEQLKNIWQGPDAEIFYAKLTNYITKLKMLSSTFDVFGSLMEKSVNVYYQEEEEWSQSVRKNREQWNLNEEQKLVDGEVL